MTQFFEKRDRWGNGYALWILAGMVFVLPLAWWSIQQTQLKNDVENWLPADDPQSATLAWFHSHFPSEERLLLSWDDSSLDDPRTARFAELLEGREDAEGVSRGGLLEIDSVVTPHDLIARMRQNNVGGNRVSLEEAVRRLQGVLVGPGMLKVRLTEAGRNTPERVRELLVDRIRDELGIEAVVHPAERGKSNEPDSFADEARDEVDEDGFIPQGLPIRAHDFQIAWPEMHTRPGEMESVRRLAASLSATEISGRDGSGRDESEQVEPKTPTKAPLIAETFLTPGAPIALTVTLTEAGEADRETTFRRIREAAEKAGIPSETVRMGGSPVAGHELNVEVGKAASNPKYSWWRLHERSPILLSCLVGVVLAFFMLRNVRLAVLVLVSAAYTMFVSVAVVPATGGSMNMVLVVMPTLLMVLTLSAAIHVANYWKNAAHQDMATAIVETVRTARTPCLLAAITTAIGLMSLTTSPLAPVRDFGLYSGIGCIISLGVVLYGFPSMLQLWPAAPPRNEAVDHSLWRSYAGFLCRHARSISAVVLVAFLAGTCGLYWFRTEIKVIHYFPDDSRVVQDYEFLEQRLSGIVPVQTVVRFDSQAQENLTFAKRLEIVRELQERMRRHPEISGTLSLADFLPAIESSPEETESASFFSAHRRTYRASHELEQRIKGEDGQGVDAAVAAFFVVAENGASLGGPQGPVLNRAGDELWKISAQVAILSDLDYGTLVGSEPEYASLSGNLNFIARSVLGEYEGADHVVTGTVPVFLRTQQAVLESLIVSFGLAFVLIAIIMMVLLKNPLAGLLAMVPNLLPVGLVFGLVAWAGLAIDIGTMITASVALGIAVDGTLHLLTWFQRGIREGASRTDAIKHALSHCGPAMTQTSVAVGMGLLMLSFAELLLISRFGWLMAALIGAALIADVVLLPVFLAGPLGALLERSTRSEANRSAPADASPTSVPTSSPNPPHLEPSGRAVAGKHIRID